MQSLSHALGAEKPDEMQANTDTRLTDEGLSAPQEGGEAGGVQPLLHLPAFSEIWAVDFEYVAKSGENPEPVCLVAWVELRRRERHSIRPSPPSAVSRST